MTTKKYKIPLFYCIFFTSISLLIHGYSYGIGDQAIHIPLIYKLQDLTFYKNDLIFDVGQQNLSLFYFFTSRMLNTFSVNLEKLLFVLYITNSLFFYLVIYKLGKIFLKNTTQLIIFGLFFVIPIHIAGSAIQSIEISLVPRAIAFTISLWALHSLFTRKVNLFYLLSFVVFIIHPLSFIYLFALAIFYIYQPLKYIKQKTVPIILIIFVLLYLFLGQVFGSLSQEWLEVLRLRNRYAFLDLWRIKEWANLVILITPALYYLFVRKKVNNKLFKIVLSAVSAFILLLMIQLVFTVLSPNILIIKLQLSRVLIFSYFVSALIISSIVTRKFQKLVLITLIALISIYSLQSGRSFKLKQDNDWIDVQLWTKNNTLKGCIFLTRFYNQGFRVYSQRPIVAEYKDGTLSFYSQEFARKWKERINDIGDWENLNIDQLNNLQKKYNFSYLVSSNDRNISLEAVYKNRVYVIYKMPIVEKDCD